MQSSWEKLDIRLHQFWRQQFMPEWIKRLNELIQAKIEENIN